MIRLSARRVTVLRARASPAQPIQGGGFGRGAKPPSEVLTNRRPHASKTRERSEDLGRLVGEMADDDVGVAHRPERSETLDDLVHRARNERLPSEPAVSAGERGFEDRLGLARRLADVDVATDRDRRRRAAIDGAALAVVRGLAARLVEREPGRGEPASPPAPPRGPDSRAAGGRGSRRAYLPTRRAVARAWGHSGSRARRSRGGRRGRVSRAPPPRPPARARSSSGRPDAGPSPRDGS